MDQLDPRWENIFAQARDIPDANERAAFVERACGGDERLRQEVETLLQADRDAGSFMKVRPAVGLSNAIPSEQAGDRIGRYKLLEPIGEGGFGAVWMAEQEEPVRRRVALKIIKLGMDTRQVLARFEAERQALALMNHPHIATVFDGGATETGRPYFVMELVKGVPITDYCDANKLPTRERLALFIQVCQAVEHAHQKGVIHRDLKPSNILVTEQDGVAVPKVIDFGVAKATQARLTERTLFTGLHQMIGTPTYMSPEQAGLGALDIDTRSDIYALGTLLYELLTGRTPFSKEEFEQAGLDEMFRLIREQDPPKPSTRLSTLTHEELTKISNRRQSEPEKLNKLLRGELDWIVMKAMEKDRRRRYETVNGLALDIQRHLNSEPVAACPPSLRYILATFIRRHQAGVGFGAALAVAILAGSGFSIWQAIRASQQAQLAEVRRREADSQRQAATQAQSRAQQSALEASRSLTRNYEREGTRLLNDRDLTGSLVYFAEALRRDDGDPDRARLHRLRIALILSQCPELQGLLVHEGNVVATQFTPDGSEIISIANITEFKTQVRVCKTAGLKPVVDSALNTQCAHVIISPGGGWLATYGGLRGAATISLWNARNPTSCLVLSTNCFVLAFSKDDRRVAVVERKTITNTNGQFIYDMTEVRVWDTVKGRPVGGAIRFNNDVSYAALSSNGTKLALCSGEEDRAVVLLLNAETWESIAPPLIHNGLPIFAGFDAAGQRLVTTSICCKDGNYTGPTTGEARVWDASTGQPLTPPLRHDQPSYQAELSPDGQSLAVVTGNSSRLIYEGIGEGQLHFWDLSNLGSPERIYILPLAGLATMKFTTDGQRILAGRHCEIIEEWWRWDGTYPPDSEGFSLAIQGGAPDQFSPKFPYAAFFACFSPDGHRCLVSNKGRALQVWLLGAKDLWTNKPLPEMDGRPLEQSQLLAENVLSHKILLMPSREGNYRNGTNCVTVMDTKDGTVKHCTLPFYPLTLVNGRDDYATWRFSPDGQRIGMCRLEDLHSTEHGTNRQTWNLQVAAWRSEGDDPLFARRTTLDDGTNTLDAVFDRSNRFLLALKTREGIRISDGQTGMELNGSFRNDDTQEAEGANFSTDGSRLLIYFKRALYRLPENDDHGALATNRLAKIERWLRIWRLDDEKRTEISLFEMAGQSTETRPLIEMAGQSTETRQDLPNGWDSRLVAFSSDARRAVARTSRNRIRIWDLESQMPLTLHIPLEGTLLSAEFSLDGKLLLTLSQRNIQDNVLQLWNTESGVALSPPLPAFNYGSVSFKGSDPITVVGGLLALERRSMALVPDQRPVEELVRLAQWLAGRRLDPSGALTELDAEAWQALDPQAKNSLAR